MVPPGCIVCILDATWYTMGAYWVPYGYILGAFLEFHIKVHTTRYIHSNGYPARFPQHDFHNKVSAAQQFLHSKVFTTRFTQQGVHSKVSPAKSPS